MGGLLDFLGDIGWIFAISAMGMAGTAMNQIASLERLTDAFRT